MEPPSFVRSRWDLLAMLGIAGLTAILGLICIGCESIWLDESFSYWIAQTQGAQFWTTIDISSPLYYILLHYWISLGDSEAVLRGLSLLLAVGTVPFIYLIGKKLFGPVEGVTAAFLLAINIFFVSFAQTARGYTLVLFLITLASYLFILAIERQTWPSWLLYALVAALALMSHALSLLVILGHLVSLFVMPTSKRKFRRALIFFGALVLFISPAVVFLFQLARTPGQSPWPTPTPPSFRSVAETFGMLVGATQGLLWLPYFGVCYAGLIAIARAWRDRKSTERWRYASLALWVIFPFGIALGASYLVPLFQPRYLIVLLPAFTLLAAIGVTSLTPRWVQIGAVTIVVVISASGFRGYYTEDHNEQWRTATGVVLSRARPGDEVMFVSPYTAAPYAYYVTQRGAEDAPPEMIYPLWERGADSPPLDKFADDLLDEPSDGRLWLVLSHDFGRADGLVARLDERFGREQEAEFIGIRLLLYRR